MKTKAVRLHGTKDLRLDEYQLPTITEDEILCRVVTDSICMSSYKAAVQGSEHKRVPENIAEHPIIIGHEFCGVIEEVGANWQQKFKAGQKFVVQPNLRYNNTLNALGYSYEFCGGAAQHIILPAEAMETNNVFIYEGDAFYYGSLSEPMSCIVGAFKGNFHTRANEYVHDMGVKKGGNMAILAGAGPMGLGMIELACNVEKPAILVVTDIDDARLERAASIIKPADAKKNGVSLYYVNSAKVENPAEYIRGLTGDYGFDDVFIMAPVAPVVEMGDALLAFDGCLNFFAGPTDHSFSAKYNFYNVHYNASHLIGTSGGNNDDLLDSLTYMGSGQCDPSCMVTHIGGLDAAGEATLNLPKIPGGKKLIYTNISLPLTAISDFAAKGETDPMFAKLGEICGAHNNLWCAEAEKYLLANASAI